MTVEKVGRKHWQALKVGEMGIFTLPNERAKECARVAAQDVQKYDGYVLERVKVAEHCTIAYKRVS